MPGVPGIPPLGGARARRPEGLSLGYVRTGWKKLEGGFYHFFFLLWFGSARFGEKVDPVITNTGLEMDIACIIPRSLVCINNVTIRSRWYLGHVKQAFLSLYECKLGVLLKMDQHPFDS